MKVLGLFSGIGGFELGFQRAGFEIIAMCEIEPYCQAVLRKHWPGTTLFDDVRDVTYEQLRILDLVPDVVTGGFPCQDISLAGKGAGLSGERSGLWLEMHRVIAETRPRYAVIENVSALRSRGLDTVLRQLAEIGYDAEWHCIPASAVGAPHRRDRVWVIAHARGIAHESAGAADQGPTATGFSKADMADSSRFQQGRQEQRAERERIGAGGEPQLVANANLLLGDARWTGDAYQGARGRDVDRSGVESDDLAVASCELRNRSRFFREGWRPELADGGWWLAEPDVGRVAHGVPSRVDRLRGLGNAVVPQIPEIIARAILAHEVLS